MNKNLLIAVGICAALLLAALLACSFGFSCSPTTKPSTTISSFEECVAAGYPVMESYPRQCRAGDQSFTEIINTEANIRVSEPSVNQDVGSVFTLKGEARVFENQLNYKVFEDGGSILKEGMLQAMSPDVGQFGSFEAQISIGNPKSNRGRLEVFDYSAKDGSEIDKVIIPLYFDSEKLQTVKVFWGRSEEMGGNSANDCTLVYPVERKIWKTQSLARVALEELLAGPTPKEEQSQGYFSSINDGVAIKSLKIEKGIAYVDFDSKLEYQVGGSCRVASISSQIKSTLRQFNTVSDVIISIDGRTEDILQP